MAGETSWLDRQQGGGAVPTAPLRAGTHPSENMAEVYDKVRVLRSEDVPHGRAVFFQHVMQNQDRPFSTTPLRSGADTQHLVALRSRDPKPLRASHPSHGISGRVMIQEAFDNKGRLRVRPGAEVAQPGPPARSWPAEEIDGNIFLHLGGRAGEMKIADSIEIVGGVPVAYSRQRPSLSHRLTQASAVDLEQKMQGASSSKRTPAAGRKRDSARSAPPGNGADFELERPAERRLASSLGTGAQGAVDDLTRLSMSMQSIFEDSAPGASRLPIALGSLAGKVAMRSGVVSLEGCGLVETPFTTARSSVPSKLSHAADQAEVDEMLLQASSYSPDRAANAKFDHLAGQIGASDSAAACAKKEAELGSQEKALKAKLSEITADARRRTRRLEYLDRDVESRLKEESDAKTLLQEVLDVLGPARSKMAEVNYRVDAQKKLLEKYKEEHGEKGMFKTLRKEVKDELNAYQSIKDEIALLEPKEKSKMKQLAEKQELVQATVRERDKMRRQLVEVQAAEAALRTELKVFRTTKEETLAGLKAASKQLASEAGAGDDVFAKNQARTHMQGESADTDSRFSHDPDSTYESILSPEQIPAGSQRRSAHDETEEASVQKCFSSPDSWIRRYSMIARATSPRWKDRLNRELSSWKNNSMGQKASKQKFSQSEPVLGPPSSTFRCQVVMPVPIAKRWEAFCRNPPDLFPRCTYYAVTFETREKQHVEVHFPHEPKGHLTNFIKMFKATALSAEDAAYEDQIATLSQQMAETATFTSLRERWAREGLLSDGYADLDSLQKASHPRQEEAWHLMLPGDKEPDTLVQELPENADPKVVEQISFFKKAPLAMIEALVGIVSVLWVPAQAAVCHQGSLDDCMYYVVSGSLFKHLLSGGKSIPVGEVRQGECFCERRLLEMGPNEATVETLEACTLYRIRTKAFHSVLSRFPGFYQGLIKQSWKRVAEWEHERQPGGMIKTTGNLPFRWKQLTGPVFHTAGSSSLRAELPTAKPKREPDVAHIFEHLADRGKKPATPPMPWNKNVQRWGKADLHLNSQCPGIQPAEHKDRSQDWWKDNAHMTADMAFMQAATTLERVRAIDARAGVCVCCTSALVEMRNRQSVIQSCFLYLWKTWREGRRRGERDYQRVLDMQIFKIDPRD